MNKFYVEYENGDKVEMDRNENSVDSLLDSLSVEDCCGMCIVGIELVGPSNEGDDYDCFNS
jgi:hypothetical protein